MQIPKTAYSKYVVLGILEIRPMARSEIKRCIREYFCKGLEIDENAVSPALRALTAEGLVSREVHQEQAGRARNVYSLTSRGEQELKRWLHSPEEGDRDLLLKCVFGYGIPPEIMKEKIRAFRTRCEAEVTSIETKESRIASLPDTAVEKPFLRSVARFELMKYIAHLDWAQETLSMIETLEVPGREA